ncbi:hypothetical protein [Photobacterium chitinilyticum]|uniref:Uncharacterized protein n=1 Tax=Photobacterium chitinilyticum TaxID=2485123 RepID=A0A444JPF2_9GAMM|nr:hypothetical protein [Photobacterium chitinilyticum]RWX54965.1 hypothetical protein EDI28_14590 [Photobacterium chitinilyticum]
MTAKRKVRPNLTNYDVLELIQEELHQSEKRIVKKVIFIVSSGVLMVLLFIVLVISTQGKTVRNYAAEAMKKAFEAERAVHIIDEAAGTNFLEQSKLEP